MPYKPAIAIHGGAGDMNHGTNLYQSYVQALRTALRESFSILHKGETAVEAVSKAVAIMEDNPLFNAGKGAVFNHYEQHEFDASVMNGENLACGAVTNIQYVRNPVLMAKAVMEQSACCFLGGENAMHYAKVNHLPMEDDAYFYTQSRHEQWKNAVQEQKTHLDHDQNRHDKLGTVGAVAVDQNGNLAAATSTGGMTNKAWGRIGDSPVIGAGTYANNNTCAVSCTGHGEYFIRLTAAHEISAMMEWGGLSLQEACERFIHDKLAKLGGRGGLIAIDQDGNIAMPFNTHGMYRGYLKENEPEFIEIYNNQRDVS